MALRHQHQHLQSLDLNSRVFIGIHMLISGGRAARDINLCPGALRQLDVSGSKIRMWMRFENRDELQPFPGSGLDIIVHIPFGVHNRGLAIAAEQVRGLGETFHKKSFFKHKFPRLPVWRIGFPSRWSASFPWWERKN